MRNTQSANYRTQAANLAYEFVDTARANILNVGVFAQNAWTTPSCDPATAPTYSCTSGAESAACDRDRVASGVPLGGPFGIAVRPGVQREVRVASGNGSFLVVFVDRALVPPRVVAVPVSGTGSVGTATVLASAETPTGVSEPAIVHDGTQYVIAWVEWGADPGKGKLAIAGFAPPNLPVVTLPTLPNPNVSTQPDLATDGAGSSLLVWSYGLHTKFLRLNGITPIDGAPREPAITANNQRMPALALGPQGLFTQWSEQQRAIVGAFGAGGDMCMLIFLWRSNIDPKISTLINQELVNIKVFHPILFVKY